MCKAAWETAQNVNALRLIGTLNGSHGQQHAAESRSKLLEWHIKWLSSNVIWSAGGCCSQTRAYRTDNASRGAPEGPTVVLTGMLMACAESCSFLTRRPKYSSLQQHTKLATVPCCSA